MRTRHSTVFKGTKALIKAGSKSLDLFVDIKDKAVQKLNWRQGYKESYPTDTFMSMVLLCCGCCKPIQGTVADVH